MRWGHVLATLSDAGSDQTVAGEGGWPQSPKATSLLLHPSLMYLTNVCSLRSPRASLPTVCCQLKLSAAFSFPSHLALGSMPVPPFPYPVVRMLWSGLLYHSTRKSILLFYLSFLIRHQFILKILLCWWTARLGESCRAPPSTPASLGGPPGSGSWAWNEQHAGRPTDALLLL